MNLLLFDLIELHVCKPIKLNTMAGGKETPRQKMIGMMYLVLTALLALNVSKSILDAFVAIEENTQKANISQYLRGNEFIADVKSEISLNQKPEFKEKLEKLKTIESQMNSIDQLSAKMIESIDALKLEILRESGEDLERVAENDEESILWSNNYKQGWGLPYRMHLMAVQAKDQYDVPMHVIIGDDIKKPTGKGKQLWDDFNNYRSAIVKVLGTYQQGGKSYSIEPKAINTYKDSKDLAKQVDELIRNSKANVRRDEKTGQVKGMGDDGQVLKDIYISLTKPERVIQNNVEGVHWIGQTFDHSPLVASLASLTSLQQDILSARSAALQHLKSKVTTGEFSFNKVVSLATGPAIANAGEEIEIKVMMAAFDSDNQPIVTTDNGEIVRVKDGQAIIKAKVSGSGEMVLSGNVAIKKKSGDMKQEPWSFPVKIMKPSGAISLPDLNVLYRGIQNRVIAVASGFDQTVLSGTGLNSLTKSGDSWIVSPGSGRDATLTVSGKNSLTNKTSILLTQKYRIMPLPKPELFWGAAADGEKAPLSQTKLFAKYGPGIPISAEFRIVNWTCQIPNSVSAPPSGNGDDISSAVRLLRQSRPGMIAVFTCKVIGPDNKTQIVTGSYRL